MITVSPEFLLANAENIQKHRLSGYIDTYSFTSSNILGGSFSISNQNTDGKDVKIGSVYIGKLTTTFLGLLPVLPKTWKGRKITVNFGLCIDDDPEDPQWEDFQIGEWFVSEANKTADGVTITAYDAMSQLDEPLPDTYTMSGKMYVIANAVCNKCGMRFGMTREEVEALPNGNTPLAVYQPNDCTTYRDIMYWLSVTAGGYCTINRFGSLVIRTYKGKNSVVPTPISEFRRVSGSTFSDWVTHFGSATFDNSDGTTTVVGSAGTGQQYQVGFDPFLQYGTAETKRTMRAAVFGALNDIRFSPFKIELMSAPIYELGDVLEFTGGIASDSTYIGIVQSIQYSANRGLILAGFGANPNLQNTPSDAERANAAAQRATAASEVVHRRFENLTAISVDDGEDPVTVVYIDFSSNRETDIEMWHEILLETELSSGETEMTIEAIYYLDGVELARKPVETFTDDARHILDLHYSRFLDDPGSHTWEVKLQAEGGSATIGISDVLALLKGQGLLKVESWNGVIILEDNVEPFYYYAELQDLSGTLEIRKTDNHTEELTDDVEPVRTPVQIQELSEDLDIVLTAFLFNIVSEDGEYNILDESGYYQLTNEED